VADGWHSVGLLFKNRRELVTCVAAVAMLVAVAGMLNPNQHGAESRHSVDIIKPQWMVVGDGCLVALHSACLQRPDGVP
jgi:fatty-acyl-CoA synthase